MQKQAHRIGSILFVLWGLLHLMAAKGIYQLAATVDAGMLHTRLLQASWHMLFFAAAGIGIGVVYNWRNSRLGFWLNATVTSTTDLGFIVLFLVPGVMPIWPGVLGPILWLLALIFSSIGLRQSTAEAE